MSYLAQDRHDGLQIRSRVDELQGDKVFCNGLIVTMDEVTDGFNHAKLDVIVNLGHQTKVQNGETAIRCSDQVAWMWVCLQSAQVTVNVSVTVRQCCEPHAERNVVINLGNQTKVEYGKAGLVH